MRVVQIGLRVLLAGWLAWSTTGYGAPDAPASPAASALRKIGILHSTLVADHAQEPFYRKATRLAIQDFRQARPETFRSIEIIEADARFDLQRAIQETVRLARAGALVIIGGSGSNYALAMAKVCLKYRVPCITHASTHSQLTENNPYMFMVLPDNRTMARAIARFVHDTFPDAPVGVLIRSDSAYSRDMAHHFQASLADLGHDVHAQFLFGPDTLVVDVVARMQAARVAVVFAPVTPARMHQVLTYWKRTGTPFPTFVGGDNWSIPGLRAQINALGIRGYFLSFYDPDAPAWRQFAQKMGAEPLAVNGYAGAMYDTVQLVLRAVSGAPTGDRRSVLATIRRMDHRGVTGRIRFQGGNRAVHDMYIFRITTDGVQRVRHIPAHRRGDAM